MLPPLQRTQCQLRLATSFHSSFFEPTSRLCRRYSGGSSRWLADFRFQDHIQHLVIGVAQDRYFAIECPVTGALYPHNVPSAFGIKHWHVLRGVTDEHVVEI